MLLPSLSPLQSACAAAWMPVSWRARMNARVVDKSHSRPLACDWLQRLQLRLNYITDSAALQRDLGEPLVERDSSQR